VTDVSGRGVGMDVVKKNIAALDGVIEIDSTEGHGMSVRVRLPLTLAIMDSMSVRVADECYVLPLASVVESFQFSASQLKTLGARAQVIQVRGEFLPVVALERVFDVRRSGGKPEDAVMVVIESDGVRIAVQVDELLGQQQVVVKNLESNVGPVPNVSGATIMGDGRVALIVDVGALVRRAGQR
jgi:two-component system chemotaxis sensor kinase CheA